MTFVDIRIGILNSPRELAFETSQTAAEIQKAVGDALAGGTVLSTRDAKKGIRRMSRREEDRALRMVKDLKTYTYRYVDESPDAPVRMGMMADDAPREITNPERTGLDVGRTIGLLTAATRALARRAERSA